MEHNALLEDNPLLARSIAIGFLSIRSTACGSGLGYRGDSDEAVTLGIHRQSMGSPRACCSWRKTKNLELGRKGVYTSVSGVGLWAPVTITALATRTARGAIAHAIRRYQRGRTAWARRARPGV
jgi:hypothetical protein